MKKILVLLCLVVLWTVPALAAQGPYLGVSGGLALTLDSDSEILNSGTPDITYDPGFGFNVAAGYNFDPVRLELEYGYKKAEVAKFNIFTGADLTVMSCMVNGYYDLKLKSHDVIPFIGAGIGIVNGELDDNGESEDDNVFGYQFTAGITAPVARNLNFDFYYRYLGTADFRSPETKLSYGSNNIFAGLRLSF